VRVLLCLDGSERAGVAVELVAGLEWPAGSTIRLATAISTANLLFGTPWAPLAVHSDVLEAELTAEAEAVLEKAARGLAGTGCNIERQVLRGRPASVLREEASHWQPDLIVMGSRGHGRIATMLLGSVTAEVVDHAACPVLVARLPRLTQVVLAHDGSPDARRAEDLLVTWPIFRQATIEVVSVAPSTTIGRSTIAPAMATHFEEHGRAVEASLAEHTAIARDAAQRLQAAGLRASPLVAQGDPAEGILQLAAGSRADLIVTGTHGRTGVTRVLLGSVARNVTLHAPCSVLVVRQPIESTSTG
jgi:uncharacterized protein